MSEYEEYHGVQREMIPWHPMVDHDKCTCCGTCVEYCKLGVYDSIEENGEKRPIVKTPNNCVIFCTGCKGECPVGAISFPSRQETQELIKRLTQEY